MAHTFKVLRDDEKQAIVDAILDKKNAAAKYRSNYESTLSAKSAQVRSSYQAGLNDVRFRQDNLLEILMAALFGTCHHSRSALFFVRVFLLHLPHVFVSH
jgi:hypothetical protein